MVSEIISRVERRRFWPDDLKLRILGEALAPGAKASVIADRNGVCRSLLYTWLRQAREGRLAGISIHAPPPASFVPVRIKAPSPVMAPAAVPSAPGGSTCAPASHRRRATTIEVTLANGRALKFDEGIDPASLACLVAALDSNST